MAVLCVECKRNTQDDGGFICDACREAIDHGTAPVFSEIISQEMTRLLADLSERPTREAWNALLESWRTTTATNAVLRTKMMRARMILGEDV